MTATLARAELQRDLHHRRPRAGLLQHSDRGCQYASADYRALLRAHGVVASMSRTGNPSDHAARESFYPTLKIECRHRQEMATRAEAQAVTFDYLETFYNRQRIHSALATGVLRTLNNTSAKPAGSRHPKPSDKPIQAQSPGSFALGTGLDFPVASRA